ncbi:alpha/beta hydrolase family protein [Campylobacter iguaniorum]|uniref:Alpha/beta hydrolase family protein n=1 Tax=Campylobacter iguaniorum TaxID=1244531 RepID=A0A076FBA7_9BACT|nr:alpha/beta fold hydrolase [Campylobacter iguaniorum]AII14737.1 alpha/beta hydrolase family protein [Campylobacter iguaniorum]
MNKSVFIKVGIVASLVLLNSAILANEDKPIVLKTMGSLFFGGTVKQLPNGETFHGDHGYAQFYIPQKAHNYPLIMWHGIGQSGRSYESTPDGREGFQAIMPRRNWAIYIIDQPRRGRAGRTLSTEIIQAVPTTMRESSAWNAFRNGIWNLPQKPYYYADTQFPHDPASIDEFFRQQTPDTGAEPRNLEYYKSMGNAMGELLKQTGSAILITHSNSGKYGWFSGIKNPKSIKAIVAFEPGHIVLPENEKVIDPPAGTEAAGKNMQPIRVKEEEFKKLTGMPILIIYGDHIATEPSTIFNVNIWRLSKIRAGQFVEAINKRGGDAKVISLPELGLKGNTHAPFADKNNLQVADIVEKFLQEKKLNGEDLGYAGPKKKNIQNYTIPIVEEPVTESK